MWRNNYIMYGEGGIAVRETVSYIPLQELHFISFHTYMPIYFLIFIEND